MGDPVRMISTATGDLPLFSLPEIAEEIDADARAIGDVISRLNGIIIEARFQLGQVQKALGIEHYPNALWVKELKQVQDCLNEYVDPDRKLPDGRPYPRPNGPQNLKLLAKMIRAHGENDGGR